MWRLMAHGGIKLHVRIGAIQPPATEALDLSVELLAQTRHLTLTHALQSQRLHQVVNALRQVEAILVQSLFAEMDGGRVHALSRGGAVGMAK